jgi:hypothetical protein
MLFLRLHVKKVDNRSSVMNQKRLIIAGTILTILPLTPAYAYVDPGTGLLLMQGLIALVGGAVVFLKNPIASIKALIARRPKK